MVQQLGLDWNWCAWHLPEHGSLNSRAKGGKILVTELCNYMEKYTVTRLDITTFPIKDMHTNAFYFKMAH